MLGICEKSVSRLQICVDLFIILMLIALVNMHFIVVQKLNCFDLRFKNKDFTTERNLDVKKARVGNGRWVGPFKLNVNCQLNYITI